MLHMHERAGIDPPPRKWVGGSFPRPRAREFCLPGPGQPQSGRAQSQCASVFSLLPKGSLHKKVVDKVSCLMGVSGSL